MKKINKQSGLALRNSKGFTLIEILVVIGIIAILATIVLIAINPARQFRQARDTQRNSNVNTILNAIGQRMADNKGIFTGSGCTTVLPTTVAGLNMGSGVGLYDMEACVVTTYMSAMPFDPNGGSLADTKYNVKQDATTGRITVSAQAEIDQNGDNVVNATDVISITR